ncbi:MAG: signal peptidase II [Acidiferrobacterales bacterium]|nr:signal peptidase II [Acidiferrobacterales bacterium]
MLKFWLIAVVVVIADQFSKLAAVKYLLRGSIELTPFLNLHLVFNSGAAFGFLGGASGWQNLLFVGIAILVSFVIIMMAKRLGANDAQVLTGLMLILGGAIGNLIDRIRQGYVVDFIDFHYQDWHWPAFNLADSAITIGAVLLVLDALGIGFSKRFRKPQSDDYDL